MHVAQRVLMRDASRGGHVQKGAKEVFCYQKVLEPFWLGGHDLGHESGHEIGVHALFRKLSVVDTTFGDHDRDQRSRRFFW